MQLIMWAMIVLVFGALTERALSGHGSRLTNGRRQKLGTAL
jgi:hypothetical protein